MSREGWILLYKKFQQWEWYDYPTVKIIFLHCLLAANFKDEIWHGQKIKRGQFPTSIEKLATLNGLTFQQTRNALKKLQTTNEINIETTNRYSIITVRNYDQYQRSALNGGGTTNKQHVEKSIPSRFKANALQSCNKQIGGSNNNTIKNNKEERDNSLSLSLEEREILKNYLLKSNRKKIDDIDAYIRKLIDNGDYLMKLEKAKKKLERQQAKENIPPPKIENEDIEETEKARTKARVKVLQGLKGETK